MQAVGDAPFWVGLEGEEPVAKEVEDCEVATAAKEKILSSNKVHTVTRLTLSSVS